MNAACGIDRLTPEQPADARLVNEGAMAEQFIAQHLPLLAPDDRVFTPNLRVLEIELTLPSLPLFMVEQTARLWRDLAGGVTP